MNAKIYVNWYEEDILTPAGYEKKVEETAKDFSEDDYKFSMWLEEHFTHSEIWDANEETRAEIKSAWLEKCREDACEELGYCEVEIIL